MHIHGGPHWGPIDVYKALYQNGWGLVSFNRPHLLKKMATLDTKIVLDNGAYSTWRSKKNEPGFNWDDHWTKFYLWVNQWFYRIEWFIIPDVIEGTEEENDRLVSRVPSSLRDKAVPVWHSTESLERLVKLCKEYKLVAIGLCGEHYMPNSKIALARLTEVFNKIYIEEGLLDAKIHGLRMLNGTIMGNYPFHSCDSSSVAINVPKTKTHIPSIECKLKRTAIIRAAIEQVKPISVEEWISRNKTN